MRILLVVEVLLLQNLAHGGENWGYANGPDELDPTNWFQINKNCIGNRQSPIDVETNILQYAPTLTPLIFEGYEELINGANITNEGNTARIDLPPSSKAYLKSDAFNGTTYKLLQFHFHWGPNDSTGGSEHVVFGKRYPLEMHMVHADASVPYGTALTEPFGLAVVSILFNYGIQNYELARITSHFPLIKNPLLRTVSPIYALNLKALLPASTDNYLTYAGSLTTPPCNEAVKWIILSNTNEVSATQMRNFRSLMHEVSQNGSTKLEPFETINRPLQSINGRLVQFRWDFGGLHNNN